MLVWCYSHATILTDSLSLFMSQLAPKKFTYLSCLKWLFLEQTVFTRIWSDVSKAFHLVISWSTSKIQVVFLVFSQMSNVCLCTNVIVANLNLFLGEKSYHVSLSFECCTEDSNIWANKNAKKMHLEKNILGA